MYTEILSYERAGRRTWIARLTGACEKYDFDRDFLDATRVIPSRSGRTGTLEYELAPGVYESCTRGARELFRVKEDGEAVLVSPARAHQLVD